MSKPLHEPARAYLEAVAIGLTIAIPAQLPSILREVARNVAVLAQEAENALMVTEEPDDY